MNAINSPAADKVDRVKRNDGQRGRLAKHQRTSGALFTVSRLTSAGNQKTTVSHANIRPSAENTAICRRPGNGVKASAR